MCRLTFPPTLENFLGNFQVSGQATKNRGTPETRTRMMKARGGHTRDILEEDLIPSFAESEAYESFI